MDLPPGLTTRPLTMDDAKPVFELAVASETHDLGAPAIDLEDIVGDWQRPSFDLSTQSVGVIEGDPETGALVAYAEVFAGRFADATVPPAYRGRGIGTWLARWTQEEARRQGGTKVGMPVPQGGAGDRLLESLGYEVAWTSWILALPAGAAIEPQPLPPGYALRPMAADDPQQATADMEQAYRVVEDAFNEWPDRRPQPFEDWAAGVVQRPGFEPWNLRLLHDPKGELVGVAYVLLSRDCGYVQNLAVRRDHRGRGLARALLVDAFEQARGHGATRSELSTDSRTGALGLYERVGMQVTSAWVHRAISV